MPTRATVARLLLLSAALTFQTPLLHGDARQEPPSRRDLVVVVDSLPNWQVLAESRPLGSELLVLDGRRDGLTQLRQHLRHRQDLDAIHLVSHGTAGTVRLGSLQLDAATVTARAADLAAIGKSLTVDGDLLIYGCDVAGTADGTALLARLAAASGADVAASADATGAATLGGNWRLEARYGDVSSANLYAAPSYPGLLNTLNAGDIVVLGWSAPHDTVTFATLVDLPFNTVITFTDKGWNQSTNAFTTASTGDGEVTWTVSGSTVPAGTVLSMYIGGGDEATTLTNLTTGDDYTAHLSTSTYTVNDPLLISGDGLFIFQDASSNPYFIFGLNNSAGVVDGNGWNTSIAQTLRDSMLPNGTGSQNALVNGTNAIGMPGGGSQMDNVQYTGATTTADRATWLARVANVANWTGDNTGVTQTSVGVTFGSSLNIMTNAAPVVTNLAGDSASFVEGSAAVRLDVGTNATVTDGDSADFNGGNVTTSIVSNHVSSEDVLSIVNDGNGAGQIGVSGSTVTYSGSTIGTFNGGTLGNPLIVSLNASATSGAVQALVRALTYANSNTVTPSTATRTVRVTIADGDGGTSANADVTVSVSDVNDPPTLSVTTHNRSFTEGDSAVSPFSSAAISTIEPSQAVTALVLTVSNVADGSDELLGVDGSTLALTNGNSLTTATNALSATVSVSGGMATVSLTKVAGVSAATMQGVVNGLTYRNTSDTPSTASRVVTLTGIQDTGGTALGGVNTTSLSSSATISVSNANDAPVVTTSGGTTAFVEADGGASTPVAVDAGLTITDVDNSTLASAIAGITGNFQSSQDVLAFTNDGTTMGNIFASYNSSTGTLSLTSAGATATIAQWQAALRSVTYTNSSQSPVTTNRTITFVANDGTSDSSGATKTISVTRTNDSPVVTAPSTIAVSEDIATAITGISFSDVDAGSASVTVTLSVPTGTLAATSGGGVTVGGTSSALTLTGSIANINTFVAGSNVTFTTASNASANVVLTTAIDDGGNTGAGGAKTDSETMTLVVTALNDTPSIVAPGSIAVTEDVATALTGISFSDVDAGSGSVTISLDVASGRLSATSGAGVLVSGSGTGNMTLTGSIANVNTFIAASGATFVTATNASSNVTLSVAIDDGGNTGSDPGLSGTSSSEAASTTVTLAVTAVNDAPVNSVPASQTTQTDQDLVFSPGNGNLLSIADVDVGGDSMQVTLTATHGLISLSGTTGLVFFVGSGTGDATMTFTGSLADVNSALNGLVFSPTSGYSGSATLQIVTNDQGASGSGGSKVDTDTVAITIAAPNPTITSVTSTSANGTYKSGDVVTIAVTFSQAVSVDTTGGTPMLLLETGAVDRSAAYLAGSDTSTLAFLYTVQSGDVSADLDYASVSALSLNGATIINGTSDHAILTLPTVGGVNSIAGQRALVIDGRAPQVTSLTVPASATYVAGQPLDFVVVFDEPVVVTGAPALGVAIDAGGPLVATYIGGTGSASLTFRAMVLSGQADADGVAVGVLTTNGGAIADGAGNPALLTLAGVGATTGVLVDAVAPTVTLSGPSVASTTTGPVSFDVTYAGATTITLDASRVALVTTGSATGTATVTGSGTLGRTITVSSIAGTGTIAVSILAGTAADAAGNLAAAAGPSTAVATFARTLTSLSPTRGRAAGGIVVTLVGAGFDTIASPVVLFGPTPATQVARVDDTHMRAVTPSLPADAPVGVSLLDGATVIATLPAAYTPVDAPDDETTDTDQDGMPDAWELWFGLDPHNPGDAALDPDGDGASSLDEYRRHTHPVGTWTRALAEGVASETFATDLSVFNPGPVKASVVLHYLRDGASPIVETIGIEPGASLQRATGSVPGLAPSSFATEIESNVPLVATGTTTWDARAYGAGVEAAVTPSTVWYLAEGATHGPFDLFYLIANTNHADVEVEVTFLRPAPDAAVVRRYLVAARSRLTLWVDTLDPALASTAVSAVVRSINHLPIAVERSMYAHDGSGNFGAAGHRAAGVAAPATTWHLAEGYVGGPFDTYLLVANPETTAADITIDVVGDSGVVHTENHVMAPGARFTRYAGDMPVSGPVGFTVRSTNAVPVIVERAMWWRAVDGGPWVEAHASAATPAGETRWGLSGLQAGGPRQAATYLLIRNVDPNATTVTIAVHLANGSSTTRSYPVAGSSRLTVDVGADFPTSIGAITSAIVSSTTPIVVEASTYWDAEGVRWGAGTNVGATKAP